MRGRAALWVILFAGCNRDPISIENDGGASDGFSSVDRAPGGEDDLPMISLDVPCPEAQPSLAELRQAFVGSWAGKVSTPWGDPYAVTATFEANGHYSAHGSGGPAFYYGTDDDSPSKTYVINNLLANGDG